jgi:pyruvate dehydrogenase E1 component alpha subunit
MTATQDRTLTNDVDRREALASPLERFDRMVEIRTVEETVQTLFNDGHVRGSTHLCNGQEAVAVGLAAATKHTDVVTCTYRGHGMALALGVSPLGVLGEIVGRVIGCSGGLGGSMHLSGPHVGLMPTFAIVGGGIPVAVGAALAARVKGSGSIAVAVFGDGATNIGAFHESLNLAAIWKLPVLFVCENNLYGEYTRIELSTPVTDLAVRAAAYGMPGVVVDGQDVDAVLRETRTAAKRAAGGGGPTLLEMKTYRYSGHSKSDPATYRRPGELDEWRQRDPIDIQRAKLVESGVSEDELDARATAVQQQVADAVAAALASAPPELDEMFRHVYASSDGAAG